MHFLQEKLETLGIGWNTKVMTERDAYRLCRKFSITLEELPLRTDGFYYRVKGRDFIAIDSRLTGLKRLFVIFHELGHFLLHVPESGATANFHGVGRRTRKEREADLFALCALMPKTLVESCDRSELAELGFDPELVSERLSIFLQRNI